MSETPDEHFAEAIEEGLVEKIREDGVTNFVLTDAGKERLSETDVKVAFVKAIMELSGESGIPEALVANMLTEVGTAIWEQAEEEEASARMERKMDSLVAIEMATCRVSEDGKKLYRLSDQGYEIGRTLNFLWDHLEEAMDDAAREKWGVSPEQALALRALANEEEE